MRKVALIDRKRFVDCFENGQDYVQVAGILGINQTTARTTIRRLRLNLHTGRHGNTNCIPLSKTLAGLLLILSN